MNVGELVDHPLTRTRSSVAPTRSQWSLNRAAEKIVHTLLGEASVSELRLSESSVHRPARGRVWVAAYTGRQGGQVWRSTGLADREQALLVARKWEAEARSELSGWAARRESRSFMFAVQNLTAEYETGSRDPPIGNLTSKVPSHSF